MWPVKRRPLARSKRQIPRLGCGGEWEGTREGASEFVFVALIDMFVAVVQGLVRWEKALRTSLESAGE